VVEPVGVMEVEGGKRALSTLEKNSARGLTIHRRWLRQ